MECKGKKIPEGWISLKFENIKPYIRTFNPVMEKNQKYIGLEHIEKDTGQIIGYADSNTTLSTKIVFAKGDLLYGKLRPYLNKVAVTEFDGVCSTDILVFPKNPFITNNLLKFCLLKSDFVQFASSTMTGVQHPRTSYKKLADYELPIPPLAEQRRIAHKIESIFAQIDACKERLEKLTSQVSSAAGSLAHLKNSVLKQAFEGKLVSQDPSEKPVAIMRNRLHKDSKELEIERKRLPSGWSRTKIQYVCDLVGGGTPSRKVSEYFGGNTIWLTPTEIPKERIETIADSREKITKLGLQKSSAKLIPSGSVLLTSRASIGFVAIAGAPVTTNQGFASFIPSDVVSNYFLAYWLWSNRNILTQKATGTTFKEIAKSTIRQLTIDLPPLQEQLRIVTKIESIFAKIDARYRSTVGHITKLSVTYNYLRHCCEFC